MVRQRGFTLFEIMMVVLIIGLIVGAATLAVGGDDEASRAREETAHFMLTSRFASEQAVLSSEILGLFVEPVQAAANPNPQWCYDWRRYRDGTWGSLDSLERRCLPETLQVDILVEGEEYQHDPRKTTPSPVLVFYPSGESTPFEVGLMQRGEIDSLQQVQVDMTGNIVWLNREREREQQRGAQSWSRR